MNSYNILSNRPPTRNQTKQRLPPHTRKQVDDPALWQACAAILESAGHLPEAADLYLKAGLTERAATIHIASKNFAAAAPLMAKVTSAKLQVAYGKAKEAQGRWQEAAAAFEAGGEGFGGWWLTGGGRASLYGW